MPKHRYLLFALVFCTAAWTGYQLWAGAHTDTPLPTSPQISKAEYASLEKLAATACDCRMRGGDRLSCDRDYQKAKIRFKPLEGATACAPISTGMDCYGEEPGKCIVTQYSLSGENEFVCTSDQADALEAAWSIAYEKSGNSITAANKAAQTVIKTIKQGKPLPAIPAKTGCT
jgi:hypothetical protein